MVTRQNVHDIALGVGLVLALGIVFAVDPQKQAPVERELVKAGETDDSVYDVGKSHSPQGDIAKSVDPKFKNDGAVSIQPMLPPNSDPVERKSKSTEAAIKKELPGAIEPMQEIATGPEVLPSPRATIPLTPVNNDLPMTLTPEPPLNPVVKRRTEATDEDLRKQLLYASEIGFNQWAAGEVYSGVYRSELANLPPDLGPRQFLLLTELQRKPEEFALPWRKEPDCTLGKEPAERLHVLSRQLRDYLSSSVPQGDVRPDSRNLQRLVSGQQPINGGRLPALDKINSDEWRTPQAIPTMMQLLQAENTPIRLLLVEMLSNISGKEASIAIAQRALFDLSAEVRQEAVQALAKRPAPQYIQTLLDGLRYPWPAAADHAAESIAALGQTYVVPDLVDLLKLPAPTSPFKNLNAPGFSVKEVVRINHLCNCVLCHSPSYAKDDPVRGRVPIPGEDPPPLYYNATSGLFVRANTTYLRQDFSVIQPVPNSGKWATNQRYDYVVRIRPARPYEVRAVQNQKDNAAVPYPQRESVLFALREVSKGLREATKVDPGESHGAWVKELPNLLKAQNEKQVALTAAREKERVLAQQAENERLAQQATAIKQNYEQAAADKLKQIKAFLAEGKLPQAQTAVLLLIENYPDAEVIPEARRIFKDLPAVKKAQDEQLAASSLRLIKGLLASDKTSSAKVSLTKFIATYPGTSAAVEARQILDDLP